ncbi:adenosine deaminase [Streptomyces iranensis]|uniref:Adenosine deaminase n=1 Tax=Streptomyces iranensis TaxID=576784 RepID=A0A061A5A1_9ACTN|nr:adenosine deaminase [Streptomyces iranensis]MBP2067484.1 adenosine deaminase [Streptomyces iranensis]CDR17524.1 adenosine deaminase [Streptomyces iranensis]
MPSYEEFLRRLPKAELHCHFVGAIPAHTAWEIARRNSIRLPADSAETLYDFADFYTFLQVYMAVAAALRTREDFAEAVYATLREGHERGNLRYREMFFNPTDHYRSGATYPGIVDGLIDGIRAAEQDFGVRCRLIPSINRMESPAVASAMLDDVLSHRRDEVIGIGLDAAERSGPPEHFAEVFQRAARAGLRRTAHTCEDNQTLTEGPPRNAVTCLDRLGCDRLDHGYNLLADETVTARVRDEQVPFTVCAHTSNKHLVDRRRHTIAAMLDAGLNISLHTDDPAMFGTDPGETYVAACTDLGLDADAAVRLALAAVDAAWLDDGDRRTLRASFQQQADDLREQLSAGPGRPGAPGPQDMPAAR